MIDITLGNGKEFEVMAKELDLTLLSKKDFEIATEKTINKSNAPLILYSGNEKQAFVKKLDIIYSPHKGIKKDSLHHRSSGFNQVLVKEMKDKDIMFGIDVSELLKVSGMLKANIIGRIKQNIKLCRKYKVEMCIFSLADSPLQLRAPHDLMALCEVLGMTPGEAKKAVNNVEKRLNYNQKKKSGKILSKGVELV